MKKLLIACLTSVAIAIPAMPTWAAELNVVTSIKPVHALVASVMAGAGSPFLIVKGSASPHAYSMKPSDAEALEKADLVFWVGHDMEVFLRGPVETLGANAKIITLDETPGLTTWSFREGGAFDAHEHDHEEGEHEDEHHDEHDDDEHDDDEHEDGDHEEHDDEDHDEHEHEEEHGHDEIDLHLWLDPVNAKAMVKEIAEVLMSADPDNASLYAANATTTSIALDALIIEVEATIAPVKGKPFIVFHDAYQYFEHRFDITAAGSITVSPDAIPGVKRLAEIREKVQDLGVICVFSEPQFEPKLVTLAIEGSAAKTGVLDPLGAGLEAGPDLYFQLIGDLAASLKACLNG